MEKLQKRDEYVGSVANDVYDVFYVHMEYDSLHMHDARWLSYCRAHGIRYLPVSHTEPGCIRMSFLDIMGIIGVRVH